MRASIKPGSIGSLAPNATSWSRALPALALCLIALPVLFHETVFALFKVWFSSDTYGHGILIIPLSLYLVWRDRMMLARTEPRVSIFGLVLVVAACLGWLIGTAANTMLVSEISLILMIQSTVIALLGWQAARIMAFALLYLFLAVPVGDFLLPHLQDIAAWIVVAGLRLFGVPVYTEGVLISVPGGNFKIAEACAGLRFMLPIIALSILYTRVAHSSLKWGALFIALAAVVTLLANALRALGIVLAAYWLDSGTAVTFDHITYGWVFLSVVTCLLFLCGFLFPQKSPFHGAKHSRFFQPRGKGGVSVSVFLAAILALFASTAAHGGRLFSGVPAESNLSLRAPELIGTWKTISELERWRPSFSRADAEILVGLLSEERKATLHIAIFAPSRPGAELIDFGNSLALLDGWARLEERPLEIKYGGQMIESQALILADHAGARRLLVQFYIIGGKASGNRAKAKAWGAFFTLLGRRPESVSISLSTRIYDDFDEAATTLRSIAANMPGIDQLRTP